MSQLQFTLEFQRHIIASIICDKEFFLAHYDVIKSEFFTDELLSIIYENARIFITEKGDAPTKEALLHEIEKNTPPGRTYQELSDEIDNVYNKENLNTEYYQNKILEFAKVQAVAFALRESVPLLESGELTEIGNLIKEAVNTGDNLSNTGYDYFDNLKERVIRYIHKDKSLTRIPTGFYILDEMMGGGLDTGEIGVMVALPKHGKTTMLVNIATNSILMQKKTAYFTLELSDKMIASKFDMRLYGGTVEEIRCNAKGFATKILSVRDKISNNLYIIQAPTKSMTTDQMHAIIRKIGDIDIVFVDYGQLIKPSRNRSDTWYELTDIYESLRKLAGELKVPIWTAHQSNRTGAGAKIIKPENIAGDFNVIGIADIIISVNQDDEQLRNNKLFLYIMGSRIGPSGETIQCDVNWRKSTVKISTDGIGD